MEEKEHKKDWLGDILVISFIASILGFVLGGMLGIPMLTWIGILAVIPLSVIFIVLMFLRFCSMIAEVVEVFTKR